MTVLCGFFNSVDGDRMYQADDMTKPYELLVSNGVFATPQGTPSNYLQVYSNEGMSVYVNAGRGIFFDKWLINTDSLYLNVVQSEVTLNRIDSVIVRVDKSEAVRGANIYIKKGTPASSPTAPTLERTGLVMEYRLANINVNAGVSTITQSNIVDRRPYVEECGWVTSLVNQVDTTTLWVQFDDAFWTWFADIKEHLSTSTLIRTFTNTYTTTTQDEKQIPINIPQFNYNLDILQVYINGLMLIRDLEYTSTNDNYITLTNGVDINTPVSFVVYKSVDGRDAETVVQQIEDLQTDVGTLESISITSDDGSEKIKLNSGANILTSFTGAGVGFHTFYCQSGVTNMPKTGAARALGHVTSTGYGWIITMYDDGSVYSNYLSNSTWRGWKPLYEANPTALWENTSGYVMTASQTITPSKPLSQCEHGWELVWADNDNNIDVVTTYIPKKNHKNANWSGQQCLFAIPTYANETTGNCTMSGKRLVVTNTNITGHAVNNIADTSTDARLFRVLEY